ncbi:MAG: ribosome hibernation factor-recruiting GTPase MRF [Mycobacteriales bacterium]
MSEERTSIVILTGFYPELTGRVTQNFLQQHSDCVVINHDLRNLAEGVVVRRIHHDGRTVTKILELAHGCISCTVRQDLLPLLHRMAAVSIPRIVIAGDQVLEPEPLCWAAEHVVLGEHTLTDLADIEAVIVVVDADRWFADVTSDQELAERGLAAGIDDERTVAQVVIAQVEFADVVLRDHGNTESPSFQQLEAVLRRLAPRAMRRGLADFNVDAVLAAIPAGARRGEPSDPHTPLLQGEPPLRPACGITLATFSQHRPFHPQRLHDSLDLLLDDLVIRAKGRAWLVNQPDVVMWLESAGGGLQIGHAGTWLAALNPADAARVAGTRWANASLNWDPYYGDRAQELTILADEVAAERVIAALHEALLTDEELAAGEAAWREYPDPFGSWHTEPCDNQPELDRAAGAHRGTDNSEERS